MALILSDIFIYPVKSTRGHALTEARVEARGLQGDRRWMIVDENGRFITQREHASMRLIRSVYANGEVRLSATGHDDIALTVSERRADVVVWDDTVSAQLAIDPVQHWLRSVLGMNVRAVFMDECSTRAIDPRYVSNAEPVSFADAYPLLLIGQSSLDDLNRRLSTPVDMRRFRPNLVISGGEAFEEDGWRFFSIDGVRFERLKPCSRCILTTRDPDSGVLDANQEPLRTLSTYRRQEKGVMFGQNIIARTAGVIRRGAQISIIG